MNQFKLSQPNAIHGNQLCDEIKQATGLDVREHYSFLPPDVVEVYGDLGGKEAKIAAVIAAHVPVADTKEQKRGAAIQSLRERAKGNSEAAKVSRDVLAALGIE